MPRRSAAALATVTPVTEHRPPPPEELTEAEAEQWRGIVNRLPSGWFPKETHGLLAGMLKHQSTYRFLCGLIEAFDVTLLQGTDLGIAPYNQLLAMRAREAKVAMDLATRLRLTPQSRYQPSVAARQTQKEPWGSIAADGTMKLAPWQKHV
jgi:hypothetical protein